MSTPWTNTCELAWKRAVSHAENRVGAARKEVARALADMIRWENQDFLLRNQVGLYGRLVGNLTSAHADLMAAKRDLRDLTNTVFEGEGLKMIEDDALEILTEMGKWP